MQEDSYRLQNYLAHAPTRTQQGKTSFQSQRRVAKREILTRPVVYDEGSCWYYATPLARTSIIMQLGVRHRLSKCRFSADDTDSIDPARQCCQFSNRRRNSICIASHYLSKFRCRVLRQHIQCKHALVSHPRCSKRQETQIPLDITLLREEKLNFSSRAWSSSKGKINSKRDVKSRINNLS